MTEALLKAQLEPVVRRQRQWKRGKALALGWGVLALLALALFALRGDLGTNLRAAQITFASLAVIVTVMVLRRHGRWQPDYRHIARQIEERHPELHALLLTAVEQQPDPQTGKLNFLQQRVVAQAVTESRKHSWVDTVSSGRLFSIRLAQLIPFGVMVWVLLQSPPAPGSHVRRLLTKGERSVAVTPGDTTIERGSGLVVLARFGGAVPPDATMVVTFPSGFIRRVPLTRTLSDPVFGGSLSDVQSNLSYHVEYEEARTRDFQVTVFDYPALQRADAHIVYPEYTGLSEKRIEETRRVSAVEGSKLDFALQLNKPVAKASFVAKDKSQIPLQVATNKPLAQLQDFALLTNGTYELQLVDYEGRTNKLHAQFVLEALKNRTPELKVLAPRGDQRVSAIEEVTFSGEAWDDFGLKDYGISYTLAGQKAVTLSLGAAAPANERRSFTQLLKLEDLKTQPDQLISWFFWADDIGPDGKLRRTSSDMFFAEVRPLEEIFRRAQSQETRARARARAPATKP